MYARLMLSSRPRSMSISVIARQDFIREKEELAMESIYIVEEKTGKQETLMLQMLPEMPKEII